MFPQLTPSERDTLREQFWDIGSETAEQDCGCVPFDAEPSDAALAQYQTDIVAISTDAIGRTPTQEELHDLFSFFCTGFRATWRDQKESLSED